jgi:hypothetical protein
MVESEGYCVDCGDNGECTDRCAYCGRVLAIYEEDAPCPYCGSEDRELSCVCGADWRHHSQDDEI